MRSAYVLCVVLDSAESVGLFPGRGTEDAVPSLDGDTEASWRGPGQSTGNAQRHALPQVLHQAAVRRRWTAQGRPTMAAVPNQGGVPFWGIYF